MNEATTITGAILAVLAALIFNRNDVSDLKAEIEERNASLRASISELKVEMQASFARVDARFERMGSRMKRMQGDINTFAIVKALHDYRIGTLESEAKG